MAKDEEKTEAPKAAPAADAGGGGSGGSKLGVILAVLNLLITLGIGAVVFIQFKKDKNKEHVADIQVNGDAHAGGDGHGGGEHGAPAEGGHGEAKKDDGHGGGDGHGGAPKKAVAKVISLEQFTVNLATAVGTPPKFARVVIAVEVASDETSQELTQKMPQVRNSIIDLFNSKRPVDLQTGEGRNYLKEEIRNALNSFLVTGKVKGIFFSNFSVAG